MNTLTRRGWGLPGAHLGTPFRPPAASGGGAIRRCYALGASRDVRSEQRGKVEPKAVRSSLSAGSTATISPDGRKKRMDVAPPRLLHGGPIAPGGD